MRALLAVRTMAPAETSREGWAVRRGEGEAEQKVYAQLRLWAG